MNSVPLPPPPPPCSSCSDHLPLAEQQLSLALRQLLCKIVQSDEAPQEEKQARGRSEEGQARTRKQQGEVEGSGGGGKEGNLCHPTWHSATSQSHSEHPEPFQSENMHNIS
eukprot:752405-Hanusia_phi.AAC.3